MKLGILGAGSIAGVMAGTVRLLNQNGHPEIELYAVAARQADRAEAFARANGVQRAYGGYEAMLADPAVDLVYIATPHSHHYGQIRMCVAYGKHVLCEKAFTVNARQAEVALREARDRGLLVTEAIWTRYQPMRRRIREVVESGEIGTPPAADRQPRLLQRPGAPHRPARAGRRGAAGHGGLPAELCRDGL